MEVSDGSVEFVVAPIPSPTVPPAPVAAPPASQTEDVNKPEPPAAWKEVLASVEQFLVHTSHDILVPPIDSAASQSDCFPPHDSYSRDSRVDKPSEKMKMFVKRMNDMRRHARAEITRLRDLITSFQGTYRVAFTFSSSHT